MSGYLIVAMMIMIGLAIVVISRPLLRLKGRAFAAVLAVCVLTFSTGLYAYLGSPGVDSQANSHKSAADSGHAPKSGKVGSVATLTEGLEARLAENPDDSKGWLLLARSYKHLGRIDDAIAAYAHASQLGEYEPELAALTGESVPTQSSSVQILGKLTVSERAARLIQPTDTVFIFARAAGMPGPPAAVLRRPASELPIDFLLDDSQSMVDGVKLSDFAEVTVTAKISRNGVATESLQNLEAKSGPIVLADSAHVNLVIE